VKKLRSLEAENARLKRMLAEREMAIDTLKCQWSSNNPHLWSSNFPHPSTPRSEGWQWKTD